MLNFYSFNLKKNIVIKDYLKTDKLINYKSLFEKNLINFDSSIFVNNFQKIDKNSYLKDLNNNIIILDSTINKTTIPQTTQITQNTAKISKYYSLFTKYPDLILFTYIITKNNYDETLYFLEKYNLKHKQIFNIIKNNQNELIEMIESDSNLLTNILTNINLRG